MDEKEATVILFEGIASIDVEGVAHDVYLTAKVQGIGRIVRWYGHFEWMGQSEPKGFKPGGFFDLSLSDGREARIRIPQYASAPENKLDFLGQGIPPGFEWFRDEVTAELASTTLPRWRLVSGRLLGVVAFLLMFSAIWAEDYQWKFLASGLIVSFMSIQLVTPGKGRQIAEAVSDDNTAA